MTTTSLLKLAERCEGLTGPDHGLFVAAFDAIFGPVPDPDYQPRREPSFSPAWSEWTERRCRFLNLIEREAWLDAAMTLAKGLERFGGPAGILREAMDRLHVAIQRTLPGTVSALDPTAYREALARFFVAAFLRALAVEGGEG